VRLGESDKLTDDNKAWLQARYDGEVRYMADQLAEFLVWVDNLPGETLVVLHSDHGEEFWEHGSFEHNHTLYQELVRAVFWIRPPGGWANGPHRVADPVGLVDLVPTLLDLVGIQDAQLDGLSLRPFVDAQAADQQESLRETLAGRAQPVGHLMYDSERWAVVADGHKYILVTWDGHQELYDLVGDPGEQRNLALEGVDLDPWDAKLSQATGWPAGPGWRVRVHQAREPFALNFDSPVRAQLLDPETSRTRRANIEWGETPKVALADVGTLVVSEDGKTVAFTPGEDHRQALIAVVGSGPLIATLSLGAREIPVVANGERLVDKPSGLQITATPGSVILPQDSVRQRIADQNDPRQADDEAALEALRALGYIE
jgi:hypothetical protein